jgi:hypothetical protein
LSVWRTIPEERQMLYSPIGLRLIDDFSGSFPSGHVNAVAEERDNSGVWHQTEIKPVITPSGVLVYPGLGRSARVASQPIRRFRVSLEADYYRPRYLINAVGIEFDVHPYDDATPPAVVATHPQDVVLLPAVNYPFPTQVRVLRGLVFEDASLTEGVVNVEVREGTRERVLTDERGAFSLPLRWPAFNAAVLIDAIDHRSGQSKQININLPADLLRGQTITMT